MSNMGPNLTWGQWLGSSGAKQLGNSLLNIGGTVAPYAASAATIYGALDNANDTRDMGNRVQDYLTTLSNDLNTDSQFQGYGVTSGVGNSTVDTDGSINLGLGMYGNAQDAADAAYMAAQGFANQSAVPIDQAQNDIYQSIMATQNPELNRMQAAQQANEYAMGRGGVRGSMYGGTAEDAAMARARAQASNEAAFQARKMASDERGMLGELAGMFGQAGSQGLQASLMPMEAQMRLLHEANKTGAMSQTGQLTGQDYLAQLALGGVDANVNAMHSANQLTGNLYNALLSNLGGTQGSNGSAGSGLLGAVGGAISGVQSLFGTGPLSDIRLKENVEFVGRLGDLNMYQWDWTDQALELGADSHPTTGVLAQEVAVTHPDSVSADQDGWLHVDYRKLV
jgi:hypothetical protein